MTVIKRKNHEWMNVFSFVPDDEAMAHVVMEHLRRYHNKPTRIRRNTGVLSAYWGVQCYLWTNSSTGCAPGLIRLAGVCELIVQMFAVDEAATRELLLKVRPYKGEKA